MGFTDTDFNVLYESTKQSTLRYITSKALNISDIEDIYQETYIRVFDACKQGTVPEEPEAYVIGVAKHCLSSHYSAVQRLRARISLSAGKVSDEPIDLEDETDIEGLIADKLLSDELYKEILRQPADVQRIFYLRYFAELPLSETASALGMTEQAVKDRLYKALRELRRKYSRR